MRINHLRINTEDNNIRDNGSKSKKKLWILINEHELNSLQNHKSRYSNTNSKNKERLQSLDSD